MLFRSLFLLLFARNIKSFAFVLAFVVSRCYNQGEKECIFFSLAVIGALPIYTIYI